LGVSAARRSAAFNSGTERRKNFSHPARMDAPAQPVIAEDPREKARRKHRRYYERHRDELRLKSHRRYYLRVHDMAEPPPLRCNLARPRPDSAEKDQKTAIAAEEAR